MVSSWTGITTPSTVALPEFQERYSLHVVSAGGLIGICTGRCILIIPAFVAVAAAIGLGLAAGFGTAL